MGKLCNSQDIFLAKKSSSRDEEPRRGGRVRSRSDYEEEDLYKNFGGNRSKGKGRDRSRSRGYGRSYKGGGRDRSRSRKGKGRGDKGSRKSSGKGRNGGGKGGRRRDGPEPTAEALDSALDDYFGIGGPKKAKTDDKKDDAKASKDLDDALDKYMGDSKDEYTSKDKGKTAGVLKDADEKKEDKEEEKKD
eukprot:TRINITY_DN304_c1_g1_i3.p1 TRINITY_DN304_c1_g1~~TRINITY_DN304_c1_g1_i3.p1  ORF type:complete len:190 (-),score=71.45 TRINITY_DN304_c1_g1_i3:239-808(-)